MSGVIKTFGVVEKPKSGQKLKESLAKLEEQLFEAEQALAREERDTLKLILRRKVNALQCRELCR